ncbi:hypothetical protein ACI6PS_13335 [Flavobacterium sp. PLA-1-15]|uniref:hypothetical protein n=1 Tax=Flavobacterium sp. PLA-1-15 TaxID=3380533 RepID=UPI003B8275F7
MKNNLFKIATFLVLTISIVSCSSEDDGDPVITNDGQFTATVDGEAFSSNDITYLSVGGTEGILAYGADRSTYFSVAIFPENFPVGQDVDIAFSPSVSYVIGDKTYIAESGTMNFSVLEPGVRMKGTFSFTGVNDGASVTITNGQFDVSK